MKITNVNGNIYIKTPYNPYFVTKISLAGAKWDSSVKEWYMDERDIETARLIMREVYGQDDRPQKLVSIRVHSDGISKCTKPIVLFGRVIAHAWGRDSGAKIGEGVSFESGQCVSDGSVKNWHTTITKSVFVIRDLPETAVLEKINWDDKYGTFEIIADSVTDKTALRKEKEILLARLEEINKELGE